MALEFGITLIFVPRTDQRVELTSLNFAGKVSFDLGAVPARQTSPGAEEGNWGNFARGAALALQTVVRSAALALFMSTRLSPFHTAEHRVLCSQHTVPKCCGVPNGLC